MRFSVNYTVSQRKRPTFKLSLTLSSLNRAYLGNGLTNRQEFDMMTDINHENGSERSRET